MAPKKIPAEAEAKPAKVRMHDIKSGYFPGQRSMSTRRYQEVTRERIQTSRLIKKLQNHALNGEIMTSSQVKAADILLKKKLPDLQKTELTGADGSDLIKNMTDEQLEAAMRKIMEGKTDST